MLSSKFGLYIHIPFCVSKCSYCDFCSFVPKQNQVEDYITALKQEIVKAGKRAGGRLVTSVYIGGGTPSVLPKGAIQDIMNCVRENFIVLNACSVTIEANPNSFDIKKAEEYMRAGCSRLSLGLQSHSDKILKILNRVHNFKDCERAVENALHYNIKDINVDIMLGVPEQTLKDVKDTLKKVVELPITHISAYGLICEPNTPLTRSIQEKRLTLPSDDSAVEMYDYAVDFLDKAGFKRYEISNFAKAGYESQHNLNYWHRGAYLGLGLGAHSFLDGFHWQNTTNFAKYLKNPINCQEDLEQETVKTAKEEMIMLALRTTKGLDILEYNEMFGGNFLAEYGRVLQKLLANDLIEIEDNILRIKNLYISNAIIAEFF